MCLAHGWRKESIDSVAMLSLHVAMCGCVFFKNAALTFVWLPGFGPVYARIQKGLRHTCSSLVDLFPTMCDAYMVATSTHIEVV